MAATDDQPNSSFLPDLCSTRAVLVVVVVAELMALVINLVAAAFVGTLLPMFLKSRNIDPALAGSVILTTVTDVVGFMSFLGLATYFYS